jgi:hypothetical protein
MCELTHGMAGERQDAAWARHAMCELTHGMAGERQGAAWARHGHGMLCVNPPLLFTEDNGDVSPENSRFQYSAEV